MDKVPLFLRPLFGWVLRNARDRVRDRENLRFERTRLFGRVRRIFVEIGRRFAADGLLDAPRDVFYLEVEECLGFIAGTATCTDLQALTALRKAEFERYKAMAAPADRFETRGVVYHNNPFRGAVTKDGQDGDIVEMDGSTGAVGRVQEAGEVNGNGTVGAPSDPPANAETADQPGVVPAADREGTVNAADRA